MIEIEIFGRHTSYNVQKVLWLADELELKYAHTEVGGRFGGNDSAEFLQMNPMGKVPVLRHGDKIVWESNTIVRYLASCFAEDTWMASSTFDRTLHERWMDWSVEKLEPAFVKVFWGHYRCLPEKRDHSAISEGVDEFEQGLLQIAAQLSDKQYLLSDRPSVADIAIGVYLHRAWSIDLEITFPDSVLAWYERLSQRPAYQRWVMSDFQELQGRSDY